MSRTDFRPEKKPRSRAKYPVLIVGGGLVLASLGLGGAAIYSDYCVVQMSGSPPLPPAVGDAMVRMTGTQSMPPAPLDPPDLGSAAVDAGGPQVRPSKER